jgi:tetratricopeptide (TPR) repeat protein
LLKDSFDVFSFLTLVCPDEPEYWYRMGLVAHKDEQHELALRALHVASDLDEDFLEPHIFSTECYLDLKEYAEARQELNEAKDCLAHLENQSWAETISMLENLIENREDL